MPPRAMVLLTALLALAAPSWAAAEDDAAASPAATVTWPIVIPSPDGELRLYHPLVESLVGNRITARSAFSLTTGQQAEPTFGVVWLAGRAATDREARTITLSGQTATRVSLPGIDSTAEERIAATVTGLVKGMDPVLNLDRILSTLSAAEHEPQSAEGLSTVPPRIMVLEHRAVLLFVDGEPLYAPLADSRFQRVQNTPFLALRDSSDGACWLLYAGLWYQAPAITGPWAHCPAVSDELAALAPALSGGAFDSTGVAGAPVAIVASLVPAEAVCCDGPPAYEPIPGTGLLVAANCDHDLFLDTTGQQHYLLLAGRWFRTTSLAQEAWAFVEPSALPPDFRRIPPDGNSGGVLVSIPGTTAAEEAALDAQIPQTATVKRDATITVPYDGDPQWQPIASTSLGYAVNTPLAVIRTMDSYYYCCSGGIWYCSISPTGPWTVATSRPAEVDRIPADNPLYNVRYAYIYDSTPAYVYVGYAPGYLGSYVYHGCVVWGTGFHYHHWWHHRHFPRHATWGFGMAYNRWTGHWGIGVHSLVGEHGGVHAFGIPADTRDGWWGPAGFRPLIPRREVADSQGNYIILAGQQHAAHRGMGQAASDNLYRHPDIRDHVLPTAGSIGLAHAMEPRHAIGSPRLGAPELIIPSHDGAVYRWQGTGWHQWQSDGWKAVAVPSPTQPTAHHPVAPPEATVATPAVGSHMEPPAQHRVVPAVPPRAVDAHAPYPVLRNVAAPAAASPSHALADLLAQQRRFEERGTQRSQQYQQYRANPSIITPTRPSIMPTTTGGVAGTGTRTISTGTTTGTGTTGITGTTTGTTIHH